MIERNVAKLLEPWRELCVCKDSGEESTEKEEADEASSFHVQSHRLTQKQKTSFVTQWERDKRGLKELAGIYLNGGKQ
jgi:hypothetical protein